MGTTEVYDATTDTFSPGPDMVLERGDEKRKNFFMKNGCAVRLDGGGNEVVVTGGKKAENRT